MDKNINIILIANKNAYFIWNTSELTMPIWWKQKSLFTQYKLNIHHINYDNKFQLLNLNTIIHNNNINVNNIEFIREHKINKYCIPPNYVNLDVINDDLYIS